MMEELKTEIKKGDEAYKIVGELKDLEQRAFHDLIGRLNPNLTIEEQIKSLMNNPTSYSHYETLKGTIFERIKDAYRKGMIESLLLTKKYGIESVEQAFVTYLLGLGRERMKEYEALISGPINSRV